MSTTFQRTFQHLVDVNSFRVELLLYILHTWSHDAGSGTYCWWDVFTTLWRLYLSPDTVHFEPLLGNSENTWITWLNGRSARLHPASWNQTERTETHLDKTKNYCESFINKTFSFDVWPSHQTIYSCTVGTGITRQDQLVHQPTRAATKAEAERHGEVCTHETNYGGVATVLNCITV